MNIEECNLTSGGQHCWVKIEHEPGYKGMQCYSCPMCNQQVYWSNINEVWVNVTPKKRRPVKSETDSSGGA